MFSGTVHFIAPDNKAKWYKGGDLWVKCYKSWLNSSFDVKMINDGSDIDSLILERDGYEVLEFLNKLPKINKIDYVRYIILAEGGAYSDMDVLLRVDFRHILREDTIYIMGRSKGLENSLMFSPNDSVWDKVREESIIRLKYHFNDILKRHSEGYANPQGYLTGARLISDVISKEGRWGSVRNFPENYFNKDRSRRGNPFSYTIHYKNATWRKELKEFNTWCIDNGYKSFEDWYVKNTKDVNLINDKLNNWYNKKDHIGIQEIKVSDNKVKKINNMLLRKDVLVSRYADSGSFYSVRLLHKPTRISVEKDKCKSYLRDEKPLWDKLRKKVEDSRLN